MQLYESRLSYFNDKARINYCKPPSVYQHGGPSKPCQNCPSCIFETKENSYLRICINYLGRHSKTTCQNSAKSMRYRVRLKFEFYRKSPLTIYMYISRNPGPSPASSLGLKENCIRSDSPRSISFIDSHIVYSKGHLYSLRKSAISQTLTPTVISILKNLGLFRALGKRAGRPVPLKRAKQSRVISVIINSRPTHAWNVNFNYTRSRILRRVSALPSQPRIIPCCMVMNTRSVAKVDAFPAVAAELMTSNCDLCFLTETWLKPIHPTHIVCPSGFCMIRKDR